MYKRQVLVSKRVLVGENKVPGVIGAKAIHMTTPAERKIALKLDQLYIDIGAPDKAAAQTWVHLGDYVSFFSPYQRKMCIRDRTLTAWSTP